MSDGRRSRLGAAALLVELDLVLDAVIQLEVVVLQRGGAARSQAAVRAGAVEQEAGTDGAQQHAQGAHDDDGDQDGVQRVEPGTVLLRHACHRGPPRRSRRAPLQEGEACIGRMGDLGECKILKHLKRL